MFSLLYPCLLLLLSQLPNISAQTNATQPQVTYLYIGGDQGWTQGFEYPPYEVLPGMQLVFEWNGQHNVVMLRDKAAYDTCNMSQSTVLATTSQGRGNTQFTNIYVYNVTRVPVFFACSLPSHCANGMKFAAIAPGTLSQFNVSQVGTNPPTAPGTPTAPGPGTPTLPGPGGPTLPGGVGGPTIPGGVGGPTIPTGTGVGPTIATAAPTGTGTTGPTTATTIAPTTVVPTVTPTSTPSGNTAPTETPTLLPTDATTMPPMTTVTPTPTITGPTIAVTPTPSMNATDAPTSTPTPTPPPNHAVRDDVHMASIILMIAAFGMTIA